MFVRFGLNSLPVNIQNADYWISQLKMIPHAVYSLNTAA